MRNFLKNLVAFALLLFFAATVSSCNRGYGCPNNFSIDATDVIEVATEAVPHF